MTPVELWVQALRSGGYVQGQRFLHQRIYNGEPKDEFCCLGVACDLYQREVGGLYVTDLRGVFSYNDGDLDSFESIRQLPPKVRDWLGLRGMQGETYRGIWKANARSLSAANDRGATFTTIADIIEARPKGLFRDSDT